MPRSWLLEELRYLALSMMSCAMVVTLLIQSKTFEPKSPILFIGFVGGMLYGVIRYVILLRTYMRR